MSGSKEVKSRQNEKNCNPEAIIFFFIDGIGFGKNDSGINPFTRYGRDFFSPLGGKLSFNNPGQMTEADPHMGLKSQLPQSGTGQTALFTGYNAAKIMKRHVAGFPPYTLRPYLKNKSLIKIFLENSLKAGVINTYTKRYMDLIEQPRSERFMSASTLMQTGSEQRLLTVEDLIREKSLFMDITNWFLRSELGHKEISEITPKKAGRRLVKIARDYNLIIYEYFFPDKFGHDAQIGDVSFIVEHLEEFLGGIWEELDPQRQLLVISSDHGNFEDLSIPVHTHNMVPLITYGCGADVISKSVKQIYDIPRTMLSLKGIPFSGTLIRAKKKTVK